MSINLDSININVFLSNVFPSDIFYNYLWKEKIKEYEEKNSNIKVRERPAIFKFIILQTLFIANTVYGINDIKTTEKYMQELNKLIMEDLHDKNDNNLTLINAKKEFEFILKHENISDEFLNDYTTLYMIKHWHLIYTSLYNKFMGFKKYLLFLYPD